MSEHLHRFCFAVFLETYRSLVHLALCHQHNFSSEKHITSKGNAILFIASSTSGTSRCWFLRLLHIFYVTTTKSYTVLLIPHIVFFFRSYNTYAVLTTDKPRLFTAFFFFYDILFKQYRRTLRPPHQLSHR